MLPGFRPPSGSSPADLQRYVLDYVEAMDLRRHIIFSCKLEHAQARRAGGGGVGWGAGWVVLRRGAAGQHSGRTRHPDACC